MISGSIVAGVAIAAGALALANRHGPPRQPLVVLLVDRSSGERPFDFLGNFGRIVHALEDGGQLAAARVNPDGAAEFDLRVSFPREAPEAPEMRAFDVRRVRGAAMAWAHRLMAAGEQTRSADLFAALRSAGAYFSNYKSFSPRYLVVFSPMIDSSRTASFAVLTRSAAATRAFIEEQQENGLLPDLDGVSVYIVGVGAGSRPRAFASGHLERFWMRYLTAAGAKTAPEHFELQLLRFP